MLRLLSRGFKKKSPLFENTNRLILPKTISESGRPNRDQRFIDHDRMARLKTLLEKNVSNPGISLSDNVKNLARNDKEFNEFLRQFRTKDEPTLPFYLETPESFDVKKYLKDEKRTEADRLDELYILDQFRKKKIADDLAIAERVSKYKGEFSLQQLKPDGVEPLDSNLVTKQDTQNLGIAPRTYFKAEDFSTMFIDAGSSTNITKLARVNKRWVLLYMGDCNGIISYGRGVGYNYQKAFEDAVYQLKRNMICLNIDNLMTCPGFITGRFYHTVVEIYRNPRPFWGHPQYYNMLALAGLDNFSMRLRCRNVNTHAIIYAFFQCFINNETPKMISEKTGQKFYEISYGRPWKIGLRSSLDDSSMI
jgi:ribosomal protein S5